MFPRLATFCLLAAVYGVSSVVLDDDDPDFRYPLPRNVENISYDVHIQPHFPADGVELEPVKNLTFDGFVRITFRMSSFADHIALDQKNLEITQVDLYRNGQKIGANASTCSTTGRLLVGTRAQLVPSFDYSVEISYRGTLNEGGTRSPRGAAYGTYDRAQEGVGYVVYTNLEPRDARQVLPCFDAPAFKATFQLSLTYPEGYTALSNTRPNSTLVSRNGYATTKFEPTPPVSTYLFAFAVGKLVSKSQNSSRIEIRAWGWEGTEDYLDYAAATSLLCVSAMEDYTGIPYELPKLDVLAAPGMGGAMENWGLIISGPESIFFDPRVARVETEWAITSILCHEIAHQWFGDLVTADRWGDLFLHESFANFFESYLPIHSDDDREGKEMAQFVADNFMYSNLDRGIKDAEGYLHPLVYSVDDFGYVYETGGSILMMLEAAFGAESFRDALRSYLRKHRLGNASYRDLVAAFEEQSHAINFGRCQGVVNVAHILDSWFLQPDVPLIDVETLPDGVGYAISQLPLTDRSKLPKGFNYSWHIPVMNIADGHQLWLLDDGEQCSQGNATGEAAFPVAYQLSPFARVRYDNASFEGLLGMMIEATKESPAYDLTFRRLLLDEAAFVEANISHDPSRRIRISIARLKLADAEQPILNGLFSSALGILEHGLGYLSDEDKSDLKELIRALLAPHYASLGWDAIDSSYWNKRVLQEEVLLKAVQYEVDSALTESRKYMEKFISDCGRSKNFSACNRVNIDILPAVFCGALKAQDASAIAVIQKYESFLRSGPVQNYLANDRIVGMARECAEGKSALETRRRSAHQGMKGRRKQRAEPAPTRLPQLSANVWREAIAKGATNAINVTGLSSITASHRKTHEASWRPSSQYTCEDCGKRFASRQHIDVHMPVHSKERTHKCDDCGRSFKYPCDLFYHRRVHTGQDFQCTHEDCSYTTPQKNLMAAHAQTHAGERPYKCEQCVKRFVEKTALLKHVRGVHQGCT